MSTTPKTQSTQPIALTSVQIDSVERTLHQTLRRLWTHGKKSDVTQLLIFAQFSESLEILDQWVRLDTDERLKLLHQSLIAQPHIKTGTSTGMGDMRPKSYGAIQEGTQNPQTKRGGVHR